MVGFIAWESLHLSLPQQAALVVNAALFADTQDRRNFA